MSNYEYPEPVYRVLELVEAEANIPPELEKIFQLACGERLIGKRPVIGPVKPLRTLQKKASELRPGDVIQRQPADRNGRKLAGVDIRPDGWVELHFEGSAPTNAIYHKPAAYSYDADVTIFDGPPPGNPTKQMVDALTDFGKQVLALHRLTKPDQQQEKVKTTDDTSDWPTQAEVARKLGGENNSREFDRLKTTVARLINSRKLKTNGKTGRECRVDPASIFAYCKKEGMAWNET